MYSIKDIASIVNLNTQNTKKMLARLGLNGEVFTDEQIKYIKEHCYKYHKDNTDRTIPNLSKKLGISRQRMHLVALQRGIIKKGQAKQLILSPEQVNELTKIFGGKNNEL